jgi:hypothetical protein
MSDERGYALLAAVVTTAVLLTTAGAVIRMTRSETHRAADDVAAQRAFYIAEAGVERGLVQLHNDRATAATLSTYRFPSSGTSSESYASGTNAIVIDQDPLFADSRRKRITSTGTLFGQTATVVARALVQNGDPFANTGGCPLLYSDTGRARLVQSLSSLSGNLFDGVEIFSNDDVEFANLAALVVNGTGTIRARGDFIDSTLLSLLTNISGTALFRTGNYDGAALHSHLLGICGSPLVGIHFGTAVNCGHGTQQAIASRSLPIVDYEAIRNHASTVVVNRNNLPFGSWHAASGTWVYNGLLSFPASSQTIYYVEGNASLDAIRLLRESDATIVARGWLRLGTISLLNTDLIALLAETQDLRLVAEGDVVVGRQLLTPLVPPVSNLLGSTVSESAALADTLGLGTGTIELLDRNRVFVFSERGSAWVKTGTVDALSRTRACILAKNDATLAMTASLLSSIGPIATPYAP